VALILPDAARRIPEFFAGSPAPYLDVVTYPDADLAKPFVSIPTTVPQRSRGNISGRVSRSGCSDSRMT